MMNVVHGRVEQEFFDKAVWDRRNEIVYSDRSVGNVSQANPCTPECEVNDTECYRGGWMWVV